MNPYRREREEVATHQEILDGIERRAAATAAGPCELDECVAGELGVSVEDYFAFGVVAGAIDRYADAWQRQLPLPVDDWPTSAAAHTTHGASSSEVALARRDRQPARGISQQQDG
jgi:hypothetical protein